jgi:hypothetical protein
MAKILLVDIETAPNIAYVWGAWKQNVGQKQWLNKSHIMSFAAKWLGKDGIVYFENRKANDKRIVSQLFSLLDEADIVIAHNAKKFDIPVILGRGVVHNLLPPSPFHIVDTLLVARQEFRFVSNSLANLSEELGVSVKDDHKKFPGFELWLECLRNNDEAWKEMKEYNVQDVVTLEQVYLKLRPYIRNHPNVVHHTVDAGDVHCPKCGSANIEWRGYYYTKAGLCYRKFRCKDCGGWGRARYSERDLPGNNGRNAS